MRKSTRLDHLLQGSPHLQLVGKPPTPTSGLCLKHPHERRASPPSSSPSLASSTSDLQGLTTSQGAVLGTLRPADICGSSRQDTSHLSSWIQGQ
ncbi:hypothetical protein A4X13_0g9174, partial [Tilletia indica]